MADENSCATSFLLYPSIFLILFFSSFNHHFHFYPFSYDVSNNQTKISRGNDSQLILISPTSSPALDFHNGSFVTNGVSWHRYILIYSHSFWWVFSFLNCLITLYVNRSKRRAQLRFWKKGWLRQERRYDRHLGFGGLLRTGRRRRVMFPRDLFTETLTRFIS